MLHVGTLNTENQLRPNQILRVFRLYIFMQDDLDVCPFKWADILEFHDPSLAPLNWFSMLRLLENLETGL